jgi:hypothetical protein
MKWEFKMKWDNVKEDEWNWEVIKIKVNEVKKKGDYYKKGYKDEKESVKMK